MVDAIVAFFVVLSVGILVAHALDAFRKVRPLPWRGVALYDRLRAIKGGFYAPEQEPTERMAPRPCSMFPWWRRIPRI